MATAGCAVEACRILGAVAAQVDCRGRALGSLQSSRGCRPLGTGFSCGGWGLGRYGAVRRGEALSPACGDLGTQAGRALL